MIIPPGHQPQRRELVMGTRTPPRALKKYQTDLKQVSKNSRCPLHLGVRLVMFLRKTSIRGLVPFRRCVPWARRCNNPDDTCPGQPYRPTLYLRRRARVPPGRRIIPSASAVKLRSRSARDFRSRHKCPSVHLVFPPN